MMRHCVDQTQVGQVLGQFEATTQAIRGIETKVDRVHSYITTVHRQREELAKNAETATGLVDSLSDTLMSRSDQFLDYCSETLDTLARLAECLEISFSALGLQSAPSYIVRECGPLVLLAAVLVLIVTVSNCIFGFLLAGNRQLADGFKESFSDPESDDDAPGINILKLFAVFHVILIGAAVLFLGIEGLRKGCSWQKRDALTGEILPDESDGSPGVSR